MTVLIAPGTATARPPRAWGEREDRGATVEITAPCMSPARWTGVTDESGVLVPAPQAPSRPGRRSPFLIVIITIWLV
jgi:hypothetical protein